MKKHKQLIHLGYIWQVNHPERGYGYEPGIPEFRYLKIAWPTALDRAEEIL